MLILLFFVARNWLRIMFSFVKDIDRDFTKFCIWNREQNLFDSINLILVLCRVVMSMLCLHTFDPSSFNSDQHQFSLNNVDT